MASAGEWWLEYYRYFSQCDVLALAKVMNVSPSLPSDFNARREVLRDVDTSHCRRVRAGPWTCLAVRTRRPSTVPTRDNRTKNKTYLEE
jgi:hypothetical protein